LVKWDVPKETNPAGEKVVILVADAAGEQTYHSFTLASPKSGKSDTPRIRIPQ
jgi:hypothetical protein